MCIYSSMSNSNKKFIKKIFAYNLLKMKFLQNQKNFVNLKEFYEELKKH